MVEVMVWWSWGVADTRNKCGFRAVEGSVSKIALNQKEVPQVPPIPCSGLYL